MLSNAELSLGSFFFLFCVWLFSYFVLFEIYGTKKSTNLKFLVFFFVFFSWLIFSLSWCFPSFMFFLMFFGMIYFGLAEKPMFLFESVYYW